MSDPQDAVRRYVVGATPDPEQLKGSLPSFDARLEEVWPTAAEGGQVVLVDAPVRHAETIAGDLGPNAQVLESESEARRLAEEASTPPAGEPHQPG